MTFKHDAEFYAKISGEIGAVLEKYKLTEEEAGFVLTIMLTILPPDVSDASLRHLESAKKEAVEESRKKPN